MADSFDVVVIGAGPGGYTAAIRAAQLGFRTACVDDWTMADGKPAPGGTCTNVGCIPSKALLQSSENFEHAGHAFADHGIEVKGLAIDVARMLARKDKVVRQNNDGILYLFRKNKVAFHSGTGSFAGGAPGAWQIKVEGAGATSLVAKHVIVATGSKPRALPGAAFDNKLVLDNDGALAIPEVPKKLRLVGADVVGLELDERGFVAVDGDCKTNLDGVWAIGDVVRGPMLAHKAEDEAVAVAERIAGQHGHVDFNTVPWVIYTSPEIAWVGQTEQQLKAAGAAYRTGMFSFTANGRAPALGGTRGFVKFLADAKTDRILGLHAIGPMVSELLSEGVVAMEFGAASEDIARICHAHPSLSEAVKEAALAVDKRTLNL